MRDNFTGLLKQKKITAYKGEAMQVKGISGNPLFVKPAQNQKAEAKPSSPKDRIEISTEARDLAKLELSAERIEEIRSKLESGFYDTDEVLQKVSEKLSKEIIK